MGPRRNLGGHHKIVGGVVTREQWLEALTENDLEDKYDWNQSRAVPEMPNQDDSRWRRIV